MMKIEQKKIFMAYLFIAPLLIVFFTFRLFPFFYTFFLSFHEWNILSKVKPWVGLGNYRELFQDFYFWQASKNTIFYVIGVVPAQIGIGLGLALLFNSTFRLKGFFKFLYFVPVMVSVVASAVVWDWLYQPRFGLFNEILKILGLPPQGWLSDTKQALFSVVIFSLWREAGYYMIIFLAGLQGIADRYYEAAKIDGANRFQCFKSITLPLLMPTTALVTILCTINAIRVFDQIYVMTEGGPGDATLILVLYIYRAAFDWLRFGYASSMTVVLYIFILIITIFQFKILGKGK